MLGEMTVRLMAFGKGAKIVAWSVLYLVIAVLACVALWVHLPLGGATYVLMAVLAAVGVLSLGVRLNIEQAMALPQAIWLPRVFVLMALAVLVWLGLMQPSHDRNWNDEVAHIVDYEQDTASPNLVTINHVRNFHWRGESDYDIDWQRRTYDINRLDSMDLVVSNWGVPGISHTFVTFGFDDGQRVAFSVEIRKERHESFSSIGGFFRQFELSIIAADEKDIIFTRSNIRQESVYLYPLTYDKDKMKALFMVYLQQGRMLNEKPAWYNTIMSNCTTVIAQLVRMVDDDAKRLPMDYRVLVSDKLPDYLIELGVIRPKHTAGDWKNLAFINTKVAKYTADDIDSEQFSAKIRENLPQAWSK